MGHNENDTAAAADGADSPARFAADLRRLRLDADSPTLAKLQHATAVSRTVISDAFAGRSLPTARTVDAIVRACDADPGEWLDRRDALAAASPRTGAVPVEIGAVPTARRTVSRTSAVASALVAFAAGIAASAAVVALVVPGMLADAVATATQPRAQISVESGVDPALTECVDDATVATGDTRTDNSLLEIVWSDKCQAGWARITRYDGLYQGNTVTIAIYPQTAPDGPDRQEATEHDVQGAYTTLVVRPSPDTLLCAEGSFSVNGERVDLGDPLCI